MWISPDPRFIFPHGQIPNMVISILNAPVIPARLAALLLRLSAEQSGSIQGYTHQDLAEAIGTYRETATQTLNDFEARYLIEIGRKQIDILDPVGLEQIAAE